MLKTRVLTAIVMALVVLAAIFGLAPEAFSVVVGLVVLGLGGWEATRLAKGSPPWAGVLFPGLLLFVGVIIWQSIASTTTLLATVCILWVIPALWLAKPQKPAPAMVVYALMASILLGTWFSLVTLQGINPWLPVWLILIIASADVGAYFSGKAFGKRKLAPSISPGKTWAGAVGGGLAAAVMTPLAGYWLPVSVPMALPLLIAGGLFLAVISIIGDLFISLLKRQAHLKDSSQLLPGHGGILDRLDSLGAALPFFTLMVTLYPPA